ncbi:MAG: HAD-IA family hydrolase [Phycisphaeraceae bacterium]|nr:HAD-IA family hydrolase [Phycisphaeraceae bacterium]
MKRPRLVLFDLGRVLVSIRDTWEDGCRAAGFDPPGQGAVAELREMIDPLERGRLSPDDFDRAVADAADVPLPVARRLLRCWLRGPTAGSRQLLKDLTRRPVTTACLSNTNARHWQMMTEPGSAFAPDLSRLNYHFPSHALGLRKPDAEIYREVESATGVRGRDVLFFDDLPDNLTAAGRLGWQTVRIFPHRPPVDQVRTALRQRRLLD